MSSMRLFIALDIPAEIRERIAAFIEQQRKHAPDARWVKPESLHVTLKFLGEVEEGRLASIEGALRQIEGAPFTVTFKDAGFFPNARSPRVFWAGVESSAVLPGLARRIDQKLRALGFEAEKREFSPHLTLARAAGHPGSRGKHAGRDLNELGKLSATELASEFGTMTAKEFFLYQSKLSPKGATYTKLISFALRAAA
jgi:RNA 2',3'-cyclic 3'-phosphodiesterase